MPKQPKLDNNKPVFQLITEDERLEFIHHTGMKIYYRRPLSKDYANLVTPEKTTFDDDTMDNVLNQLASRCVLEWEGVGLPGSDICVKYDEKHFIGLPYELRRGLQIRMGIIPDPAKFLAQEEELKNLKSTSSTK